GDIRCGDAIDDARAVSVRQDRQRAAMSGDDAAPEAVAQRRLGDSLQAARVGRAAFIHVQIEVEAIGGGDWRIAVAAEPALGAPRMAEEGNAAQEAAMPGGGLGDGAELRLVVDG